MDIKTTPLRRSLDDEIRRRERDARLQQQLRQTLGPVLRRTLRPAAEKIAQRIGVKASAVGAPRAAAERIDAAKIEWTQIGAPVDVEAARRALGTAR